MVRLIKRRGKTMITTALVIALITIDTAIILFCAGILINAGYQSWKVLIKG